jgi:hypothetical protein
MRKLPLATLGAATALGLLAAAAQAEPVKLSLAQMDELTAGQTGSVTITLSTSSDTSSSISCSGDCEASADQSASTSAEGTGTVSFEPAPAP